MSRVEGWDQLKYLLPEVQGAELRLRGIAQARGISYTIADYGGARTEADTAQLIQWRDEAVAQGGQAAYYRVAPFSSGKHGVGGAFDIRVTSQPAGMTTAQAYAALGAAAPSLGLIWGGTFSPPADPYHFESAKSRAELASLFAAFQAQSGGNSDNSTVITTATATTKAGSIGVVMLIALALGLAYKALNGEL